MSGVTDFRGLPFNIAKVDSSGREVGRRAYWKLYAIENLYRVVIHSVLTAQVARSWWAVAAGTTLQDQVAARRGLYAAKPWHSTPGKHDIYYTFLADLNKIVAAHRHLFLPVIPDIDTWIARVEQIRLPRNIVGHMNWPNAADRKLIDGCYQGMRGLLQRLGRPGSGVAVLIP